MHQVIHLTQIARTVVLLPTVSVVLQQALALNANIPTFLIILTVNHVQPTTARHVLMERLVMSVQVVILQTQIDHNAVLHQTVRVVLQMFVMSVLPLITWIMKPVKHVQSTTASCALMGLLAMNAQAASL